MTTTAHELFTPLGDIRGLGASRRGERTAQPRARQETSRKAVLEAMALRDTGTWMSSRARSAALGRWWPALLMLALAWVAWLNTPSACIVEESAWREADAHLTRLMIRAHRAPSGASRPVALAAATSPQLVEQHTLALQSAGATEELLRAKRQLDSSLGELRMCRQGGALRAERERAAGAD